MYSNTYSFDTTRHKSTKIYSLHTTIHSLHTKFRLVSTQGHNKTYNLIMAPHHCRCHRPHPRRILPCLEPHLRTRIRPMKKDACRHKLTSKRVVPHFLILRKEQLNVGTNDLPSVVKKNVVVAAASVSSTEGFPMVGISLQQDVPMSAVANIPSRKVGEEC
jgi:hypothetical protein